MNRQAWLTGWQSSSLLGSKLFRNDDDDEAGDAGSRGASVFIQHETVQSHIPRPNLMKRGGWSERLVT